ncbi:MAG: signal peptide peptidase SppA [Fibrobacterales bacterium]
MSTGKVIVLSIVALMCSFFIMVGGCSALVSRSMDGDLSLDNFSTPHIGLVKIEGAIHESEKVVNQLERMRTDENIRGVVVRVNSPGGTVASSQEINSQIARLRADSIPVVASYGDIAASGGLYSTLSAQKIFANEGTLTGSIGVIFQFPDSKELLKKIGLSFTTVKSGDLKDVGSPFRHSTAKEIKYLESLIDDTYEQFFTEILKHRSISEEDLIPIADGRVITGKKAYEVGLIDTLGTLQDAIIWLKEECNVAMDTPVEEIKPKKLLIEHLMQEPVSAFKNEILNAQNQLLFMMH